VKPACDPRVVGDRRAYLSRNQRIQPEKANEWTNGSLHADCMVLRARDRSAGSLEWSPTLSQDKGNEADRPEWFGSENQIDEDRRIRSR
jgi:hypothetical protein